MCVILRWAGSVKEFKRAVAYLLQHLDLLTEFGMLEFVTRFLNIAKALELHGSLLRPTVSSHLYVYNPVMIHVVLVIVTQFAKAFEGDEHVTVKRLATLCRESQQPLPVRLLGLHWLLGLEKQLKLETSIIESQAPGLYPRMYDPLALQALKLETSTMRGPACVGGGDWIWCGPRVDGNLQGFEYGCCASGHSEPDLERGLAVLVVVHMAASIQHRDADRILCVAQLSHRCCSSQRVVSRRRDWQVHQVTSVLHHTAHPCENGSENPHLNP